jgi:hypothetical protein
MWCDYNTCRALYSHIYKTKAVIAHLSTQRFFIQFTRFDLRRVNAEVQKSRAPGLLVV